MNAWLKACLNVKAEPRILTKGLQTLLCASTWTGAGKRGVRAIHLWQRLHCGAMSDRPLTRLFHDGPLSVGAQVRLDAASSHHAVRVLRLAAGSTLEVFNGQGLRWPARLVQAQADAALVELGDPLDAGMESPLALHLAQCLPAGDKMDWVIEKAVELGVRSIQPLAARRSVLRLEGSRADKRLAHWRRIAIAACMQSGRDTLPEIGPVLDLRTWLRTGVDDATQASGRVRWVLMPGASKPLGTSEAAPSAAWLLVGPEGGLDDEESQAALQAGWTPLRLGPRVLRTETAGLAALAALQLKFGDF